ncbi:MAG: cation-transporting P-type ATPase [Woeseiaceae bacterium]|jgi:Ca2+-transporting ATPase|nr:cation-transporting P-type ATPase [Woeseiaceae bacterium]
MTGRHPDGASGDIPVTDPATPWARDAGAVLDSLGVDPAVGLDGAGVVERRGRYGPNQLRAIRQRRLREILVDQFRSIVVVLLAVASTVAIAIGDVAEGIAILAVILINSTIGFLTEWRAVRSMEALTRLGRVETVVVRDGATVSIPAEELVPGDIVVREGGDIVTADIRLLEAAKLTADESTLTGESMPVNKTTEAIPADTPLADRHNMLFKGTSITRGSCKGVVVATGLATELGRISELVESAEAQETPLEKRLDALAQRLVVVVLSIAVAIAAVGVVAGRGTYLAIEVAIALAVAAIPEGLPIVATIALARGMWRMARRNALVARLSAVETLGATSVILTDKTGTLTENRMTVTAIRLPGADTLAPAASGRFEPPEPLADAVDSLLLTAALCNNAVLGAGEDDPPASVGDPTEVALLRAAAARGIHRDAMLVEYPEVREHAFDPDTKLMATEHDAAGGTLFAVKGAPEAVVPICSTVRAIDASEAMTDSRRERWLEYARNLGAAGLRTLAVARKSGVAGDPDPYRDLELLGVVGLEDPPRQGVGAAIERCRDAGIAVLMVTGDHAATARNIATALNIVEADAGPGAFLDGPELANALGTGDADALRGARVYSRVSPEQKLELITYYQQHRQVVAMTGDGVNDAPALKKADIGVAMGVRGTAVAKEAAAMVLRDDEFGTIVEAVAQGRAIYENIRKFVVYLLSCNISEVLVVALATLAGAPLPLLPLQILFLNLVTDVFPALALGVGEGAPRLMQERPRPFDEAILTRRHWTRIALHGVVLALTVLGAMALAVFQLGFDADRAVTVSFCTLALAQLWHVFNMREDMRAVFSNEITRNIWVWAAVFVCVVLVLLAVYVPVIADLLDLVDPGPAGWAVILAMSLLPLVTAPLVRALTPASTRFG